MKRYLNGGMSPVNGVSRIFTLFDCIITNIIAS